MRTIVAAVAISCLALAGRSALCVESVTVVQNGRAAAQVVVSADRSDQVMGAAQLVARYVQLSSGAELSIAEEHAQGDAVRLVQIHVGETAYVKAQQLAIDGLDDDGFVIRGVDREHVVIAGPTDYGTEFGVYELLERYVGVRWLMPGPDGDDVPRQATIRVPVEEVRQEPAFFSRLFSGLRGNAQVTWARRNRLHGRVSFHHNLIRLFPPEKYTETQPHFFPVIKSRDKGPGHQPDGRFLPPTNGTHGWQPCFTADGIVEEGVKNICQYFDEHPDVPSYSLGVNDSSGHCECETCQAKDTGEKNFLGRRDVSDRYFEWCNKVVQGVLRKHPGKHFGCLAYSEVAQPPSRVKVHERIIPYMTYDRMKWVHPELRAKGEEMTRQWERMCPTVGWYDYIYGSAYCVPRVWFHHMGEYYRFGHAHGVRALYAESYPNWGEGPKLYVSLKLQWNPQLDVDELLREWCVRMVGADGADELAAYYAHWEDFWTRRILDSAWFTKGGQYLRFGTPSYLLDVTEEEIAKCRELLEGVVGKARTPKQKARAQLTMDAFEYYEASVIAYSANRTPSHAIRTEAEALAVLDRADRYLHMAEKRKRLALEVFPKHPVLRHGSTWDRLPLVRGENWGSTTHWSVFNWAARSDGPVRQRLRQLAATAGSRLRDHARLMLVMIEKEREPFSRNPSCEHPEDKWPTYWNPWVKWGIGSMEHSPEAAHTGRQGILCKGMKRGGPHQSLPITPGRYGAVAFVRVPQEPKGGATITLSMTLRSKAGQNLRAVTPSTQIRAGKCDWMPIAVAGDVPARAGKDEVTTVLLIVVVDGFEPGEEVHIDDVTMFRLEE